MRLAPATPVFRVHVPPRRSAGAVRAGVGARGRRGHKAGSRGGRASGGLQGAWRVVHAVGAEDTGHGRERGVVRGRGESVGAGRLRDA